MIRFEIPAVAQPSEDFAMADETIRAIDQPSINRPSYVSRTVWTCVVFAVSFLVTLWRIGAKPFWLDETFTIDRARLPLAALIHNSLVNHHLPTYFLLIHAILPHVLLGHHAELLARLPSALCGAASVALVFLAGWRIAGPIAGLAAALILGLSPALIAFSQEARSYTMVMACILVALHGIIGIIGQSPRPFGRGPSGRGPSGRDWALYGLGTLAAILVLGDAILWMIFVNVAMLPVLANKPWRQRLWRPWLAVNLLILVTAAPFYELMNSTVHGKYANSFAWIPRLDGQRLWSILASVYLDRIGDAVSFRLIPVSTPNFVLGLSALGLPLLVLAGLWRLRGQPALRRLLLIAFAGLPIVLILVSISKPVLLSRYLFWSAAPFAILAGIGFTAIAGRGRIAALIGMTVLLAVSLVPYYHAETKPRWDIAAHDLAQDMRPGDRLFVSDRGALRVLRLYLPAAADKTVFGHITGRLDVAKRAMADGHRVWMVYGRAGQGLSPGWYAYASHIASLGEPALFETAGTRIRIGLFDPANEAAPVACSGPQPAEATPLASMPQPVNGTCG
jgi:mannosyltransferase